MTLLDVLTHSYYSAVSEYQGAFRRSINLRCWRRNAFEFNTLRCADSVDNGLEVEAQSYSLSASLQSRLTSAAYMPQRGG